MNSIKENIRVLYIEDDPECSAIVDKMLRLKLHKTEKFEMRVVESMEASCRLLEEEDCDVDVVLLDLMLPNSEGIRTYETMKNACPDLPIVIMSEHEDIALECIKRGAQDYIIKPDFSPEHLARSLKYAVVRNQKEKIKDQFIEVFEHTPLGILLYQLKGNDLIFIGNNPASNKILNYDNNQNIGKTIEEAYPPLADTEIPEAYKNTIRTGVPWHSDGVYYDHENISGCFRVHAFKINGSKLAVTFEDVTEAKKVEQKYMNLIEASGAAVYEIDFRTMKFTYVNDQFCKATGWTRDELLNLNPSDILTEKSFNDFMERLEELKKGNYIDDTFEYEIKIKNGSVRWVLITVNFIDDKDLNIVGASVVAIDITDKKVEELLIEEREKAAFQELGEKIEEWRDEILMRANDQKVQLADMHKKISNIDGD